MSLVLEGFQITNITTNKKLHSSIGAESISNLKIEDKITPEYNETYAFGKFDPIVNWKNTKRNVSVSFTVSSMERNVIEHYIKYFAEITLPRYSVGEAIYVSSTPVYKLNLFGYFEEFGVIKNLSVVPNFTPKKLLFSSRTSTLDDIKAGNVTCGVTENISYSFTTLNISFDFTVLHKIVPNPNAGEENSLSNWPFKTA